MFKLSRCTILCTITLSFLLIILSNTCYTQSSTYKIFLNKKELITNTHPINVKGRIMVPIRKILEFIDADFEWIPDKKMVKITKDNNSIDLRINTPFCSVNGKSLNMDVPALIRQDRTYVPVRFLAESLEMDVHWDESANAVMISTKEPQYIVPAQSPTPSATPISELVATEAPTQVSTPAPQTNAYTPISTPAPTPEAQKPSPDVYDNIKVYINGEDIDYKFIGAQLIDQQGILYADRLFVMVAFMVYCQYDSATDTYQLKKYSDEDEESFIVLNTKPIDKNYIPVLEVCKELNLKYEYKDHVLNIIDSE
ncbi:MAG TPA: stalk domain-containing protein [Pseudobacteroides sp.]|uniref:stalk domain-containing protein n=1 Tax=Pseudobacteroides sp. TaxID=1968840 RepID=UPI002F91E7E4